ncbi:cache domain-containing sensor histidine kinase [Paenibacillus pinistramenti]|uniref:cache domain-containing sensor histidine kinase n=1 Tax=Paenibacillus pinistramenti TaxID=1768003 RepID=UPI001EF0A4E8|nr:sensor histidine kinase [Paenibacillus pinistramenti]
MEKTKRIMRRLEPVNTLRNQIFVAFFLAMLIILGIAGSFIYGKVSTLLKNNAEKHIKQTAVQASGRLDALMTQIDSLTAQVAGSSYVQQLLTEESDGQKATFNERQALLQIAGSYQAYTPGVESLELYSGSGKLLFPIREGQLDLRVEGRYIEEADNQKGRLVWVGIDPANHNSVLAIRRVNLFDRWFSPGGYLIARIQRGYFQLNEQTAEDDSGESILLANDRGELLGIGDAASGTDLTPLLNSRSQTVSYQGEDYVLVKQYSEAANWTLLILTPVQYVTKGISVLRTALFAAGGLGALGFLVLSFFLSTMLTRPIIHLIRAMRKSRLGSVLMPNPEPASTTMELKELNHSYNEMVHHINRLIRVVYEKETLQSRTELKALQAQINPHFLFNTLEAFNWSLIEKGEEELAGLVVAMSRLFRYIISNPDKDEWVTVADEFDQVERYLKIMSMRLGDRLEWSVRLEPDTARVPIPKLLVQPIVENAVKYGVESKIGKGRIEVLASLEDGKVRIEVADDGRGMNVQDLSALQEEIQAGTSRVSVSNNSTGVGLVNVQRRLKLYYSSNDHTYEGLQIRSSVAEGTTVSFSIPLYPETMNTREEDSHASHDSNR